MIQRFRDYSEAIIDRLADVTSRRSFLFSELHFSLMMVIWGIWLWLPGDTFASAAGFSIMAEFATAFAWGLVAIMVGISRIRFLLHGHKLSLSVLTLVSGWYWTLVGMSFLLADPPNTGFVAYTAIGLYEFWVYRALLSDRR